MFPNYPDFFLFWACYGLLVISSLCWKLDDAYGRILPSMAAQKFSHASTANFSKDSGCLHPSKSQPGKAPHETGSPAIFLGQNDSR